MGTEQFNIKPSKGLQYLQEQGLLSKPLNPTEVVAFFRENHRLDKKQIGEYISDKKNKQVLEAFVQCVLTRILLILANFFILKYRLFFVGLI